MAYKLDETAQGWLGYGSSGTPPADQPESRNREPLLPQDSVVINKIRQRQGNKLGEGALAKVYFGMHMGEKRAIKVFLLKLDCVEEFEKLNGLKHPNIVRVYGMWEDPYEGRNAPAIVMELCDHSLQEYIQQYYLKGKITREHKLKILHDITCAMVFLHSKNVVHGDLSSPNVLVNKTNDKVTAKLTDFKMSRVLDPQSNCHITASGPDAVNYLPPELFNRKGQNDRKKSLPKLTTQIDVFMFGPVAIELACGEFPRPTAKHKVRKGKVTRTYGEIERRVEYLKKVKASDWAIVDGIVKMCLAENPEDRGTFLDLQWIVGSFQQQKGQPDNFQGLYEEAQEKLEGLRSQLEAESQVTLCLQVKNKSLEEELSKAKCYAEYILTANKDFDDRLESLKLERRLKEKEVTELRATVAQNEERIQDAKEDLKDLDKYRKRVQELKNEQRETNTKASQDQTKRNSQAAEDSQKRQDIEGPLLVEINTLKERLSQREADLLSSSGRISELERDIDASKAHSAELQSELNHTDTGLTSTRAELDTDLAGLSNTQEDLGNTQVELRKAQKQNEPSSIRCQELEQQCQKLRLHIAELESAQSRLQKSEEDLSQQVEVLKSERDTAQRQAQDFDRDSRDLKLKLQMTQSDYENEQRNCERERDTTKDLRTENAQLVDRMSSLEREVQALKDKGRHRREVMQQMVKLLQTQVAAVRSDLDQERSRQSDLKESVEQLLTRSYIVRLLKTELASRATELQKCKDKVQKYKDKLQKCRDELQKCRDERQKFRDELKTTTAEKDYLGQKIATQQKMDQYFHRLEEQIKRNMFKIVAKLTAHVDEAVASVHKVSAGVSELSKEVDQFPDQTSSTSPVQQNLTAPAPVSKNLTEDGTRPQEMLCIGQPLSGLSRQSSTGEPNALLKYQPGGAEGASVQCSSPDSAMDFWPRRDSHARTTGQTARTPLLQGPADFNVESFMNGCKDDFLNDVKAKPIAAYLKSENVIPPQLNEDIDGADTKKGTLLLFEHFKDQGRPESILILCKVMEESGGGHPRMINFAKVLKDKLNKCPH